MRAPLAAVTSAITATAPPIFFTSAMSGSLAQAGVMLLRAMVDVLEHVVEPPRQCDYLAFAQASLEYRLMKDVSPDELEQMLARGWRRLGPFYFRPACAGCFECVSLRIPVGRFAPRESQKRARRRARRMRMTFDRPRVDRARLALYERWHAAREQRRGWDPSPL